MKISTLSAVVATVVALITTGMYMQGVYIENGIIKPKDLFNALKCFTLFFLVTFSVTYTTLSGMKALVVK